MKDLKALNKKRIELDEIQKYLGITDYLEMVDIINKLIDKQSIAPIKSSKFNGKSPALYNRYTILEKSKDYSSYINELNYDLHIKLSKAYYIKNIEKYIEDREYILALNDFLKKNEQSLYIQLSTNERSFQIWGKEKFLSKGGERILKNLGLDLEFLNIYETTEPLPYYSYEKNIPQNILIIENKDTFYTFRKYLLSGKDYIFGEKIFTVIYGGGKRIFKNFKDFTFCVEPYLSYKENNILYLGDLDYEGILIYENLQEQFKQEVMVEPFIKGYEHMIDKYLKNKRILPMTKKNQNRDIKGIFLSRFDIEYRKEIECVLKSDRYIPQEILTIQDLEESYNGY